MDFKSPIKAEDTYEEYIQREYNISAEEYEKLEKNSLVKSFEVKEKRGRKKGFGILSEEQQNEIKSFIENKHPKDFNFNYLFWTTKNVTDLIFDKYKLKLPPSTTRDYLSSWFNLKKDSKGNKINLILTNGIASNIPESIKKDYENNKEILLSAKKDKAIIFLIRINTNSFIETISGRNQNGFIFIKKMKEKTNFFKELKTFYGNKKIYLIFDNVKEDLRFMDSLLDEKQLSIYHGFPPVINGLYRRYKDENGEQKILSLFTKLEKSSIKNNKLEKTKPMNKVTKNSEEIIEDDEWPWFNEQEEE